ncbi:MAG: energy transducer TonB [Cyclobacteriaceae bacterium]
MKIFNDHSGHVSLDEMNKYLDNKMSNDERHLFERHLLSCDFCDEAFEGYQLSEDIDFSDSIKKLAENIEGRSGSKSYFRFAVAAAVILLLGASVVFTMYHFDNQAGEVAMAEKKEEKQEKQVPKDSVAIKDDALVKEVDTQPIKKEEVTQPIEPKKKEVQEEKIKITTNKIAETKSNPVAVVEEELELADEEIDAFGASDESFEEDSGFGDEFFEDEDSVEPVQKEESFKETNPLPIQVENRAAYARKLSENSKRRLTTASKADVSKDIQGNALPVIGFERYGVYLKDSLRYPMRARENGLEGIVKLQFRVTLSGALEKMEIVEGLSEECNAEAKRLVIDGSNWTLVDKNLPVENNVVNLSIEFKLSDQ